MIEQLPKHEDEWAYYESEPLFDYVCQVSEEKIVDVNPDGRVESDPHLQLFHFASDYLEGKIDTDNIRMELYESPDIQNTLKAFDLNSSKFWYLCLFIKWRVDYEYETAFVFPKSGMEQLLSLADEFKKLSPEKPATLSLKIGAGKTITINNSFAIAAIGDALINHLPELVDDEVLSPKNHRLSEMEKVDWIIRDKIYLFYKYMSVFVNPLNALKGIYASKDKSLLISRMIYIFGISYDKKLYTDLSEKGNKQNQLKGYLSRYKHKDFLHF